MWRAILGLLLVVSIFVLGMGLGEFGKWLYKKSPPMHAQNDAPKTQHKSQKDNPQEKQQHGVYPNVMELLPFVDFIFRP